VLNAVKQVAVDHRRAEVGHGDERAVRVLLDHPRVVDHPGAVGAPHQRADVDPVPQYVAQRVRADRLELVGDVRAPVPPPGQPRRAVAGRVDPGEGQPDGGDVGRDRFEDAVHPGRGDGPVLDVLQPEPERRRTARPPLQLRGVLLAADHVVRLDPPVLGAADVLHQPECLAGHAGGVGEVRVGGHHQDPVVGEQLTPQFVDLLGAAEPLGRIDGDQVGRDEAEVDLPEHRLEARRRA
jgi:hypothetical protein